MGNQQNRDSEQTKKNQQQDQDQDKNVTGRDPQEDQGRPDSMPE
jgi:hypothetical protein